MVVNYNGLSVDSEILGDNLKEIGKIADALRELRISPVDTPMDLARKMPQVEALLALLKQERKFADERRQSVAHQVGRELASGTRQVMLEELVQ